MSTEGLSARKKHPFIAEVKNAWSFAFTVTHFFVVVLKYIDNLSFFTVYKELFL
jgi:hypothetical protein